LQDRGRFFIFPQEEVYAGQVVGEHNKDNDLVVNVTKSKKLTNMRASGADDKARIIPPCSVLARRSTRIYQRR
jgi:GTP-binding protein